METCTADHVLNDPNIKPNWQKVIPTIGEGTFTFNVDRSTPFCIVIRPKVIPISPDQWISLEIGKDLAEFKLHIDDNTTILESKSGKTKRGESVGYEVGRKVSYWFSYDRTNLTLKYGKGYRMTETTIMEHDFLKGLSPDKQTEERKKLHYLFDPEIRRILEQYDIEVKGKLLETYQNNLLRGMTYGYDGEKTLISSLEPTASVGGAPIPTPPPSKEAQEEAEIVAKSLIDMEGKVAFDKTPFTCNWPPFVLDSSKITLFELDSNNYTLSASLPSTCRELYHNVVQEGVSLDFPPGLEEYKLSDAIRYSIESKDGILHKKLAKKASEFGESSPKKTYLRVTLGRDRGNSPGIPYVLEIWPKDHGSPIHNHGNAYAVIKVLHGGLTIHVYNKHTDSDKNEELFQFDVKQGDVTWISPNWYQTHKLWNTTNDYCATLQCYQYGEEDNLHWPYFDYVKSTHVIDEFLPNSDFKFHEMREEVLKEYKQYMESKK